MTLLQIDSLQQLKNNSGFWDNFVWPLALAFVIAVVGLLWKILTPKQSKTFTITDIDEVLKRLDKLEKDEKTLAKKENKMENEDTKMNITSYGQSGGITAGIVNISNSNQYVQPSNTILSPGCKCSF